MNRAMMISFRRTSVALLTAAAVAVSSTLPALSAERGRSISLLRDAEAEALITDYTRPILKAAGLGAADVQVKLVNDDTFNAFVADSRHIFVNAGAIIDSTTPNQLIGVLAHEIGHLAANHLSQLRSEIRRMQILSALAVIGGVAAGAAGGGGAAASALATGGMQFGQRGLLMYARENETAADQLALKYLAQTGQSAKGMLETFQRFADQQMFMSAHIDPYIQSHPMAADRIAMIDELAHKSKFFDKPDNPALQARHDLVRAKFAAFTRNAQSVMRLYPPSDTSLAADYARAIVAYRFADPKSAVARMDDLIKRSPNNPYFWELKGQILLETGKPRDAVAPLRKAVSLAPNAGQIRVLLGQALVGTGDGKLTDEAIAALNKGIGDDPDQPVGYRQLAIAYARKDNIAMADLASAQGSFAVGDIETAKKYAIRAQEKLKTGSPAWLRADDIVTYKIPR
ncbi:Beta-barrel assembly-enhancing protease [Pleomorphomonas sp. T1.2MG-36]|uniref:M48 family metalloprotease n=1 Tax=Pleomorphomonas sp. T1.2MG-36 TaxID=3041167 RepID=UPI002477AAB4|nr:M48 family metalloprotease [Pleomorphomonas sp. T1.2MG-36]CAI9405118.1 Beta-barrel assembly-enhancing protease [Pleomorphomonas sp. T1.2MG-36]